MTLRSTRRLAAATLFAFFLIPSAIKADQANEQACLISMDSASLDTCTGQVQAVAGVPAELLAAPERDGGLKVIKYRGPISVASRALLAEWQVEVVEYLPWFAYVVRAPNGLPEDSSIGWSGQFLPAWKIDPRLIDLEAAWAEAPIELELVTWPGFDSGHFQAQVLMPGSFEFINHSQVGERHYFTLRSSAEELDEHVQALALEPAVQSISLRLPARLLNSQAGWLHQSGDAPGNLPVFAQGIFGCGQTIGVLDSGYDFGSCAFRDDDHGAPDFETCTSGANCPAVSPDPDQRKFAIYYNWGGGAPGDSACGSLPAFGHGTHVAGSIAGNQVDSPVDCDNLSSVGSLSNLDGTAPGARLIAQKAGGSLEYLNNSPAGNIYHAATIAYQGGARIHNNSWGSGCCDPFIGLICLCSQALPYDGNARLADQAGWEFPELLVVIAAGNDGSCCGNESIGNPALAKNSLSVGATNRGTSANNMAAFSSRGPTRDRRIKPDVVAQGNNIVSAGATSNPSTNSCDECTLGGTSMASPTAAGLAALVRDYLAQGFYPDGLPDPANAINNPSAALVRAIVINSARSISGSNSAGSAPNMNQGWGRVTLDDALYFDGDERRLWLHDEASVVTDQVDEYLLTVEDADQPLKITLVWHDYPGANNSNPSIVNLLRLEVETPSGDVLTQKLPPSGLPNPFWNSETTDLDDRNTVHQYSTSNPELGVYQVRVRGVSVAMGDDQPYALVATGAISLELPDLIFADGFE